MKHLFKTWQDIHTQIKQIQNLLLFLDFDGTLTPIVSNPEFAECPPKIKKVLKLLKGLSGVYIFIISGRSLKDLKRKVSLKGIFYIGNHGLEMEVLGRKYKKTLPQERMIELKKIKSNLKELKSIPGVILEDKGLIISVHFRNTPKKFLPKIFKMVREEAFRWKNHWKVLQGKMVLEIGPKFDFNKGMAVIEILKKFQKSEYLPVYLGDDKTDEDAFRVLRRNGITVFIGSGKTSSKAKFFLRNTDEVQDFLLRCKEIRMKKKTLS